MELEENAISYKIRSAIFKVYNNLGPGLLESAYEVALRIELYENGVWSFSYSDVFKTQDKYEPLVNFPNLNQEYKSDQLWPFFASRLPGVSVLKEKERESMDVLSLLKKYGHHVITNPYKLVAL